MSTIQRSRRRQETDFKILRAVLHIATTQGLGAVTIEEVARSSGVAKTTIYRRYTNTDDMLDSVSRLEAFNLPSLNTLPTPSKQSMMEVFTRMEQAFVYGIGVRTVGMVISSRNDFFRNVLHHGVLPVLQRIGEYFRSGIRQGVFRPDLDIEMLTTMIIGSLVAHHALAEGILDYELTSKEPYNEDVVLPMLTDSLNPKYAPTIARDDTQSSTKVAQEPIVPPSEHASSHAFKQPGMQSRTRKTAQTSAQSSAQSMVTLSMPTAWAQRITEQLWPAISA